MPEGDTLYRTAARLRGILQGKLLQQVECRDPLIAAAAIENRAVTSIETRGKHLLFYLDDGCSLHSHLGMTGSWHVYRPLEAWHKPERRAAIVMRTGEHVIVCFSPRILELLTPAALRRHPMLGSLGLDILAPTFSISGAAERFRSHPRLTIGEAVMNQTIVCGIGNIYKSETLFLARQCPFQRIGDLPDRQIEEVVLLAKSLMSRNLGGYPRRTRSSLSGGPFWVYGREGRACYRCRRKIQVRRQGDLGRTTFWCHRCQLRIEC